MVSTRTFTKGDASRMSRLLMTVQCGERGILLGMTGSSLLFGERRLF
jgi:hypothetical protein